LKKTIFTYWHQGFDQAPEIVKACARVIERHHPDWDIHFLDAQTVDDWIDPMPIPREKWERLQLAHRSDLIRTQLLIKHGGVWADPTVWFSRPLDDWLPSHMEAGLFLFRHPGRDRTISNWFITAEPGNPLLVRLYDKLCAYWSDNEFDNFDRSMSLSAQWLHRILRRNQSLPRLWLRTPIIRLFRTFPYMIYHYAFHDLVRIDAECRAVWDQMPDVRADGPVRLLRHGLNEAFDDTARSLLTSPDRAPLYKLTWKGIPERPDKGTVLGKLLELDREDSGQSDLPPHAAAEKSTH
jgi:hypothetical protein